VAGGLIESGDNESGYRPATSSCEIRDPTTGTWSPTADMLQPRARFGMAALPDGTVLVAGGINGTLDQGRFIALSSAERYNPVTNEWTAVAPMSTPRADIQLALLTARAVVAVGGSPEKGTILDSAELFEFGAAPNTTNSTFGCLNGACVPDPDGVPFDMCERVCLKNYVCQGARCVGSSTGVSLSTCESLCLAPNPDPTFVCIDSACVESSDPTRGTDNETCTDVCQ
jgi:hypothetical protein